MTKTGQANATNTIRIEKAAYRLTGIVKGSGNCDACNRELVQRVFAVAHKTTGVELALGRRCAAKATGYAANAVERQAAIAARIVEVDRRLAVIAVSFPEFAAATDGLSREYGLVMTAATEDMFWGGYRDGEWVDYLNTHGAR